MTTTAARRTPLWARLLLAVLAATLIGAACGDDGDDRAADPVAPAATATADAVAADRTDDIASADATEVDDTAPAPSPEQPDEAAAVSGGDLADDAGEPEPDTAVEEPDDTAAAQDAAAVESEPGPDNEPAAQRIVSISPTATEMAFAIGAGDRVVAVDQFSYYPAEAPVTDLDGWNPNVEAIASYDPDLVLLQTNAEVAGSLEALGIEVWAHDAPFAFDDVYAQIEQLGAVTGQGAEVAALVADMRARIDELIAAAPDASGLSYYHELDNTLYTVTSGTFIGQVYGLFGLTNVADPADADGSAWGYPQLSDEYLVDADPDIIFLADTLCCGQDAQTVAARPGWDLLTAVQAGRIVELDDDIVSRWGPRLVDFIAAISGVLVSIGATS